MIRIKLLLIVVAAIPLLAVPLAPALAAPISGVSAIRVTDNDGNWFYQEEINIFNMSGTDVASLAFGSTTTLNFPGTSFGSSTTGAINDVESVPCCGNGTHGNIVGSLGQFIQIDLPSVQNIDAMTYPIEIYNRSDGCCPERVENIDIEFLDAMGVPITVLDALGNPTTRFSLNGPASFDTNFGPGGGTISINGVPEPASIAIWSLLGLALFGYGFRCLRRKKQ